MLAPFTNLNKLMETQSALPLGNDKRSDLIQIQWFVVIACSYLLIVQDGELAQDSTSLFLLSLPLASIAVFLRLPNSAFAHRLFPAAMAMVDTLLFSIAIIFNRQSPWDLCLVFFFGILIAAIGENLLQIIVGSLVVGVVSVLVVPVSGDGSFAVDTNTLLRIPLLFGAALVYGHLSDQVKREKKNTAQLEELRRQQLSTKDAFISHVSHELRTPITAIYQFVTILSDQIAGPLNDEQREYLGIVERNVKQLQAMVGDLLDAARAEGDKLIIDPRVLSLPELVEEVLTNHRASAAVKSIALSAELGADSALYADPQRVKQVLSNLVGNAVKFTPEGGKIAVSAQLWQADAEFVRISVVDNGCGISAAAKEKIFDRLYQEEVILNTNRKGLGLGLYICHELVTRQGGRIWVESDLGKGSAFHFTLPAFSLRNVLLPFVKQSHFYAGLTVISVDVVADRRIELSEIGKAVWGEKWSRLSHFALPADALLLPRMVVTGRPERFFIIGASDRGAADELARRIEREVGPSRRPQDAKFDIKTTVTIIDPLPQTVNADIAILVDELSHRILSLAGLNFFDQKNTERSGIRAGLPRSPASATLATANSD